MASWLLVHERWAADWVAKQREKTPTAEPDRFARYGPEAIRLLSAALMADGLPGGVILLAAAAVRVAFQHQPVGLAVSVFLLAVGIGAGGLGIARSVQAGQAGKRHRENSPFKE